MEILLISMLTLVASIIGTISGFGISTIMVSVLINFYPIGPTLLLVGIIHWFADMWRMIWFRQGINWKIVLGFGIPGVVFSTVGAKLSFEIPEATLKTILGAFLIAYVLFLILKPEFKVRANLSTAGIGGMLAGFVSGIFGMGGSVRGAFLTAFDLPKAVYLFTNASIAFLIDSARVVTYQVSGALLSPQWGLGLLIFIPASLVGTRLGKSLVDRIPQNQFRWVIAIFLLIAGLNLVI